MTPYMMVALFSYLVLCLGLFLRKNRRLHPRLMLTAIGIDLLLVLVLQIERNAIQTAAAFTLSPLQQIHVAFSAAATGLYLPVLYFGIKLWGLKLWNVNPLPNNQFGLFRKWHIRVGITAFVFRTLGLIFMFSLIGRES